ncbi:HK97 gp10 family phage protein [Streptomyces olivochromogenes]|uniref:HK97 gp10 family phage protein n=1 Tax=Streptomyces olivochromogenes TaxID=1963 RepID=A0A250VL15_STROL|nr:HK97 gp10 family phage protein [Streptomyces olivochromogenes]GAX54742.1 hypothetical protein SO3561_06295 [Streptomyces olivochromogenes]
MGRVEWEPDWEAKIDHSVSDFLEEVAKDVLKDMQVYVPKDTGRLLNDLDYEVHGLSARIGAKTAPYAYYVEVGTRPHLITPNGKGALSWEGAEHPVNEVNPHPGTTPTNFMKKSLYKSRGGA